MRSKAFILFFSLLSLVAALHLAATAVGLYWEFPWLDKVMHGLAGACVVLGVLWVVFRGPYPAALSYGRVLAAALCAIVGVGIGWEFFEYAIGFSTEMPNFWLDTAGDLVMDTLGGSLGYWMFVHEYRSELKTAV